MACFPENGGDADSLMAFAEQALARAKEARRASRNVMLQLEHSVRGRRNHAQLSGRRRLSRLSLPRRRGSCP